MYRERDGLRMRRALEIVVVLHLRELRYQLDTMRLRLRRFASVGVRTGICASDENAGRNSDLRCYRLVPNDAATPWRAEAFKSRRG